MIVRVEREFEVISPQYQGEEERERERRDYNGTTNGLEETLCTFRLKENIGDPSKADVYNPRGGRVSTLNSQNLPVLGWVQLSAERGVLYRVSKTKKIIPLSFVKLYNSSELPQRT